MLRILGVLAVLLVAAAGVGAWWWADRGEDWLERNVRERIGRMIDEASVPGYTFRMDALLVDTRTGHLRANNVVLDFDEVLLDSLRSGEFRYLFAARAGSIELRGLSFWRLLVWREFRVEAFEMREPELYYLVGGERVALSAPFTRLQPGGGRAISLVRADTLIVRGAAAKVEDLSGSLPVMDLSGLAVAGYAVRITMDQRRSGVRLTIGDTELGFDSLRTQLPDGDRFHIGHTSLSRHGMRGLMRDIRLIPAPVDTTDRTQPRKPVIDLAVDSITLQGLDIDRLIAQQALHIGELVVRGMRLKVVLDKTLPPGEPITRALPAASLLAIPFAIRIDTLTLLRASGTYHERDPDTRRWGRVPFRQIEGRFTHITNFGPAIVEHPKIEGGFSLLLFDSARVSGRYTAELDGSDRFTVMATVTDLPLENLNSATRPLLRIQVNGGRLHRMDLRMEGDDRRARGDLALNYTDLLVRVEPGTPRELRHSMFGSVLETMLKEAYGGGLSADRERNFSIDRDQNKAIITYLWHATREGLARNLAPEAWERMRSMLRTDAEQRREQRSLRKQRREERQEQR